MRPDLNLDLGTDLRLRTLGIDDAALVAEATSRETKPALWGPRPAGPYSPHDAQAALLAWDPAAGGQFSIGILRGQQLLGAIGLMPDGPGSVELAYWIRPGHRGRGIASQAVQAITLWVHRTLDIPRIWLEIRPGNETKAMQATKAISRGRSGFRPARSRPRRSRALSTPSRSRPATVPRC